MQRLFVILIFGSFFLASCFSSDPVSPPQSVIIITPLATNTLLTPQAEDTQSDREIPLEAESMKGYELYSWQESGEWHFSLAFGTNRRKNLEEIKKEVPSELVSSVQGVEALKDALFRIKGTQVIWLGPESMWEAGMDTDDFVLPPEEVIQDVRVYCERIGTTLDVLQ